MLKRMSIRKIILSSITLLILFILYLIPGDSQKKLDLSGKQTFEYVSANDHVIYLMDSNNYVARTRINTCQCTDPVEKARDLLEGLIIGGKKDSIIPNGFRSIIPSETKILNITLQDGILKIDFSKDILEVKAEYEEKMIEAITYSLTSIDGVKGIIIYVEGELLAKLPNSGKNLPTFLDKGYGINKIYDISNLKNIDHLTVFYINKHNNNYYYVPVTKYINNQNQDKIKIIIDELTGAPIYESNLMSFLNVNAKLLNYEINDKTIKLNFNNLILTDISEKSILEEVAYTIALSVGSNYDIEEVDFYVDNTEILKTVIKNIE